MPELSRTEAEAHLRDYREQLDLAQQHLDGLQGIQDATDGFQDFLSDFQDYAKALADTKDGIGGAQENVEYLRNSLEATITRFLSAHKTLNTSLEKIADGLGKTGKQIGRVTEKLEKLEEWTNRITSLPKMTGELTDDELIEAFTGYFGLLTDVLSGLTKLFPPLAAMVDWYGQVVAGLEQPLKAIAAGKARTNDAIASFDRLLDDPYLQVAVPQAADTPSPYAQAVADVERLAAVVRDWEERVEGADASYRQQQAAAVEEKVLRQQQSETGQRADEAKRHVEDAMLAASSGGEAAVAAAAAAGAEAERLQQDFRDRLADHLAGNDFIDDEIVRTLFANHPWLEAMVRDREAAAGAVPAAGGTPVVAGAVAPAGATARFRGRRGLAAAAGGVLAAVIAVPLLTSGGDSDSGAPASSASSDDQDAASPAVTGVTEADTCAPVPDHGMTLSSPAIDDGGTIPAPWNSLYDNDALANPPLQWSAVPDGTAELAVVVVGSTRDEAAAFLSDPEPWRPLNPSDGGESGIGWMGDTKWMVTGITPSTASLPSMGYVEAVDSGLTLHRTGVETQIDDEWVSGFFVAPDGPSDTYLFTLFALCRPSSEGLDPLPIGWLVNNRLAYATFAATG